MSHYHTWEIILVAPKKTPDGEPDFPDTMTYTIPRESPGDAVREAWIELSTFQTGQEFLKRVTSVYVRKITV